MNRSTESFIVAMGAVLLLTGCAGAGAALENLEHCERHYRGGTGLAGALAGVSFIIDCPPAPAEPVSPP